jgi:hypothetical protein
MKQHWVPRSYLEAWATSETQRRENPLVWAFNIAERRLFSPSVKNVFAEKHFYSMIREGREPDLGLERHLAKVEGEFVGARDRAEQGRPSEDDEAIFCAYAAYMHARSKTMRDHHRAQWQGMVDKMELFERQIEETGSVPPALISHVEHGEGMTKEHVQQVVKNTAALIVPTFAKVEARVFASMNRITLIAGGNEIFIASDNPCSFLDSGPPETGFYRSSPLMSETLEVYLPVSPRMCFVWSHDWRIESRRIVDDAIVRSINLWLACHADVLVSNRPLFEKTYAANPRLTRLVTAVLRRRH